MKVYKHRGWKAGMWLKMEVVETQSYRRIGGEFLDPS